MGTITGISDLDAVRWQNSHWRSVKVGWDESTAGERQPRVSFWEIEPLTTFPMYPSPFPLRLKRPWPSGLPSFHGLKDGDMSMNTQMMWLQGGGMGDQGMQSLNFQGYGVSPWMQPRLDPSSMAGVQPDVYQAMAAAALQEMRTMDSSKMPSQSLMQSQNFPNGGATASIQRHMLQQHSQNSFLQNFQENQTNPQPQIMQHQLQRTHSYNNNDHQQQQLSVQQQMQSAVSALPHLGSNSQMQSQTYNDIPVANTMSTSNVSSMQNILGTLPQEVGGSHLLNFLPKQAGVESQLSPRTAQSMLHQQLGTQQQQQSNVSELGSLLPPFPGREYTGYNGPADPQSNLLFGVNIDSSSLMMQHGLPNLQHMGSEGDSLSMPFAASDFSSATGTDFPNNLNMTTSSCVDESGFLQSSENVDQVNPSTPRTFVKVHKSGSIGRSLDISKFSSYGELRSELARMFGLEGQLEDPQRSGWQLVFVDRENELLLLGDDPWQEFVNSVWYIKILSPLDVQQMGKEGLDSSQALQQQPM
ncbi:hypothetical protein ACFE04_000646 [Oxalis oulophora]